MPGWTLARQCDEMGSEMGVNPLTAAAHEERFDRSRGRFPILVARGEAGTA